jgi:GAF domain-containing protein
MTPQHPTDPITAFSELGRIKLGETDLDGVLARIANLAGHTLPRAADVSVTLFRGRTPYTAAFTGDVALELDTWQYVRGRGPCLDAAVGKTTVWVRDMTDEPRWPDWAGHAASLGTRSSVSIGLPIQEKVTGALNVYGAHTFEDETVRLAETFAGYAAVAMANAHLYDTTANLAQHMQSAMESRAVIEQAKGIIMGERRCTAEEAFAILTKVSQNSNRKVRDVAMALVRRAQTGTRSS